MLLAIRYLNLILTTFVGLIMLFLTTLVGLTADPLWLAVTCTLIVAAAVRALIRIAHPPAPPYPVQLLFPRVRERHGVPKTTTPLAPRNT